MAIRSIRDVVAAELEGRVRNYAWNKTNAAMYAVSPVWGDVTGASGNPRAKQWFDATPLTAQQIRQSTDGGIYHGPSVAPATKYVRGFTFLPLTAIVPCSVVVCDYLLYYPTIEDGTTDPQVMDNTQTLPRFADGKGVQMMAVTISSRTGGQTFSVTYMNDEGVSGRVTPNVTQNATAAPGTITTSPAFTVNTAGNPFLPLAAGDSGVKMVESVTMNGTDTGFFAIVLVKPLFNITAQNLIVPYEKDLLIMGSELPIIEDDAFISYLMQTGASNGSVTMRGSMKVIWG